MGGIPFQQRRYYMGMALLCSLMQRSIILISSHIDLSIVLKQETYHRQIAEVRSDMNWPISSLCFALDVRTVLH